MTRGFIAAARRAAVGAILLAGVGGRVCAATAGDYFQFEMNPAALAGAPDVSALNQPLDASARIVAHDGHFYRVGRDGLPGTADDQRVRLFGVNLTFGANFPDDAEARQLARQLRALGFNAVRLHHLDSLPSDYPDAPISILGSGPFPTFSPAAVARLRGLIQALAKEGIYVDLNLHVGYRFRPGVDGLPALDGGAETPPGTAAIHLYYPRLIEKQETYARQLIHALELKGNPALAMVEINNESSLLAAWLGQDWQATVPSAYAPELQRQWRAWLTRRYGSLAQACAAWSGCAGSVNAAGELPTPGQRRVYETGLAQLRSGITRRLDTWFGEDKKRADPREQDFLRFLAATDQAYFERLRRVVQESTDAWVPVTGTQMGFGGLLNFDSQAAMDYIDEHFYVAHPDIKSSADDWRIPGLTASGNEFDRVLALSLRRDRQRPYVISEFNEPFPNPRGAEILPLMSAVAALQDWDGLFYFDYSDAQRAPLAPSRFSLSGDWGRVALAGQSARLFRQPLLAPLPRRIDIALGPEQRLALGGDRRFDAITHGLADGAGVRPQLAYLGQVAMQLTPAAGATPAIPGLPDPAATKVYATPDGALRQDAAVGRVILDAPAVWGVFGATGTTRINGASTWVQFGTPGVGAPDTGAPGAASMLLTSLDGRPLAQSRHLLLSLGNDTTGTQPGSMPQRPKQRVAYRGTDWMTLEPDAGGKGPSGDMATRPPAWLRRIPLELGLAPRIGKLTVYPLDGAGGRSAPLSQADASTDASGARIRVQYRNAGATPWYELVYEETP
ncbi:capsular biosynthesis protein [Bordetella genomosp. 10]|uniref:Capsular biosynthesis protein n=1 Tax=Bordetella genomosp. 10 TaxID=1416804 RepID=A0A261RZN3_9BORD|nr:cellulase family glycosylhydrolase [Bordetella genomosp. 10]OZI30207.1 capsular biosynthesis protein [Bordetella genomosp. 10]